MEILNTYTELNDFGFLIFMISVVLILIAFVVGAVFLDDRRKRQGIVTLLLATSMLVSLIFNFSKLPNDTYHDVIIENFSEVDYSKYKISNSKGKIITIKEVK